MDKTFGGAMRQLEAQLGMPLSEVPIEDHHDNCGLGFIDRCTCDPQGQCNLATTGECECGPWVD